MQRRLNVTSRRAALLLRSCSHGLGEFSIPPDAQFPSDEMMQAATRKRASHRARSLASAEVVEALAIGEAWSMDPRPLMEVDVAGDNVGWLFFERRTIYAYVHFAHGKAWEKA